MITSRHPPQLVPAYFHPAVRPQDWAALAEQAHRITLVVLNVATGPGQHRDPGFDAALERLRRAGIPIAGYIDTDYAARPAQQVHTDLARYRDWYAPDGVFFDRAASDASRLGHYATLADAARALGMSPVVFNHGTHPVPAYRDHADLLGTFEGPWNAYVELAIPRWARDEDGTHVAHLVHSVPPGLIDTALDLAAQRRVHSAYVTHHGGPNPWRRLCTRRHPPSLRAI
ncbi:MAG TPA: spherulation-specific family 4 protein [Pseudonocardiaceae bacterium]|nr:spherulation-specific family 4 protein [Pseudonocardiaceae bacterium]